MPVAPDVPDVPESPEVLGALPGALLGGGLTAPGAGIGAAGTVLAGAVVVVVVDSVVVGLVTGGGAAAGVVVVVVVLLLVPLAAGSLLAFRLQALSRMPATAVANTIFVRLIDAFILFPFTEIGSGHAVRPRYRKLVSDRSPISLRSPERRIHAKSSSP